MNQAEIKKKLFRNKIMFHVKFFDVNNKFFDEGFNYCGYKLYSQRFVTL